MPSSFTSRKRAPAYKYGRRWAAPIDQTTTGQALRQPGIDPRQWASIGIVTAGGSEDSIVIFDEDEGQPLVRVLLEPSKVPVMCRVSSTSAGNGEGEWNPFVEGDEVLVIIPEGNERSGCVIIGKLNNGIDKFPMQSVAGQDPTTNTFAFSRRRTPRVEEFNGPIVFRSAMSEALFSLDTAGVFTVRTGDKSVLQMSPDVIGFQGPSDDSNPPEVLMQMNLTGKHFTMQMGDALFNLSANDATPEPSNMLKVSDPLSISTNGNNAAEHAMSIENFVNIMVLLIPVINPLIFSSPSLADAAIAGILTAVAPSSAGWVAGTLSQQALNAAMLLQPQKLPGPSATLLPGVMSTGLQIG